MLLPSQSTRLQPAKHTEIFLNHWQSNSAGKQRKSSSFGLLWSPRFYKTAKTHLWPFSLAVKPWLPPYVLNLSLEFDLRWQTAILVYRVCISWRIKGLLTGITFFLYPVNKTLWGLAANTSCPLSCSSAAALPCLCTTSLPYSHYHFTWSFFESYLSTEMRRLKERSAYNQMSE